MLTNAKMTSSAIAIANYAENEKKRDNSNEGYYSQGEQAPSQWIGQGAKELGLEGSVKREDFIAVLEAKDERFKRKNSENTRLATDFTFSAPKSVSLLALSEKGDKRLIEAHNRAVEVAMTQVLEQRMMVAREGKDGVVRHHSKELIAARYTHEDARPVGKTISPQLHDHVLVANLAKNSKGEWKSLELDFGSNNELYKLMSQAYKSELQNQVRQLGYETHTTKDSFELSAVSRDHIETFSGRSKQIEQALAEMGVDRETATKEQKQAANKATRQDKVVLNYKEQRAVWDNAFEKAGLDIEGIIDNAKSKSQNPEQAKAALLEEQQEALKNTIEDLSERKEKYSVNEFTERLLYHANGSLTVREAEKLIKTSSQLVRLENNQLTDTAQVQREGEIVGFMEAGQDTQDQIMSKKDSDSFIAQAEKKQGFEFSQGQRDAIELAFTTQDQIIGIMGSAGAGKTTSMQAVASTFQQKGYEVVGLAPSHKAVEELAKDTGANSTGTLKGFTMSKKEHDPNQPRLIILDEAGMASSKEINALMQKLTVNDRVLLVGDQRQIQAVEAGTPFELLQMEGMKTAHITEIRRQKDEHQNKIARLFASGKAEEAIKEADKYIQEIEYDHVKNDRQGNTERKQEALANKAVSEFLALDKDERSQTILISETNALRQKINDQVREKYKESAELGSEEIELTNLRKTDFTRIEKQDLTNLKTGMILKKISGQNASFLEIKEVDLAKKTVTLENGQVIKPVDLVKYQVFNQEKIKIALNEQLMMKETNKEADVKNGEVATVTKLTETEAVLSNGQTLNLKDKHVVDYAYCRTAFSSQGATVKRAIAVGEGSRVGTANTAYVAATRQKEHLMIITDSKKTLAKKWSQWSSKQSVFTDVKKLEEKAQEKRQLEKKMRVKRLNRMEKFKKGLKSGINKITETAKNATQSIKKRIEEQRKKLFKQFDLKEEKEETKQKTVEVTQSKAQNKELETEQSMSDKAKETINQEKGKMKVVSNDKSQQQDTEQ